MDNHRYYTSITKDLWAHQKMACIESQHQDNYALFFEMGTGKTATAIALARLKMVEMGGAQNTLIVCPKIVVKQWGAEINRWSKLGKNVVLLEGPGAKRVKTLDKALCSRKPLVVIMNPETLSMSKVFNLLKLLDPKILIVDESHKFKNPTAKRTKLLVELSGRIKHKFILTGTPVLNSPMDLYSQYLILDGGKTFGKNFFMFRAKYFEDKNAGMKHSQKYFPNWVPRKGIEAEFNSLIKSSSMFVKKSECLDLPPLIRKRVNVEMSNYQKAVYKEMANEFVAEFEQGTIEAQIALTKILRLQQIVSGFGKINYLDENEVEKQKEIRFEDIPRLDTLKDILEEILPNHKAIIWTSFKMNYQMIENVVRKLGYEASFIYGGQTDRQREASIEDFKERDEVRVMIANQKAGGVGLNLIEASYSIYYSRTYSLEDDLQSEARNHRGGSEVHDKVTRIDLVTPGSVDELILEALEKKQNIAENILEFDPKSVMLK